MHRAIEITVVGLLAVCLVGCLESETDVPIWEQVKIGDLAPAQTDTISAGRLIRSLNYDTYIYEVPAENFSRLGDLWQELYVRSVRFSSAYAFKANYFNVGSGDTRMWGVINDAIAAAGGRRAVKISLMLANDETQDLIITRINDRRAVHFVSKDGAREQQDIGPGALALRIKAARVPGMRDLSNVMAYPVFTVPVRNTIRQLVSQAQSNEMSFISAGFGIRMSPGDIVVLGPSQYVADSTTLSGLFFGTPQGGPFPDSSRPGRLERKPAVRIFVLVCTSIRQ